MGNIPNIRYQATTWTDKNGNGWLFGGVYNSTSPTGVLDDLWEFNTSTKQWALVAGSGNQVGQAGVYGTMGTPSSGNSPGARSDAAGWTDNEGNLWLFGGYGIDSKGTSGVLNDLWKFTPSNREWTWMSGSSTVNSCFNDGSGNQVGAIHCAQASTYGSLGTPAPGNTPGSREGAITWTDNNGNLWLFGGWSYDVPVQVQYYFNEIWEYNTATNQWAWMGGSSTRDGSFCFWNVNLWYSTCGEPGVPGTTGTPAPGNIPGGRMASAKWTDSQGNLWLFSGSGFDVNGYFGDPNDLWKYSPSSGQWTFMGGNKAISPCADYDCSGPAVYGTLGIPAAGNIPLGRDHAVAWTDSTGNFWLFGGGGGEIPDSILNRGTNELWEFSAASNQWALMGGTNTTLCGAYCNSIPVFGVLGVPAPGNGPGARFAASGWADSSGNFWLFGGMPPPITGQYVFSNDLWEYQPSTESLPTTATPNFSVPAGSYTSEQAVTISDTTNGAFIYYTTDGTSPTINSLSFVPGRSQPIQIHQTETLKAIAVAGGCLPSTVATAAYTLTPQTATPTFSLPQGTYTTIPIVTISDSTPGATIYYTTDGSIPNTNSTLYSGPITINGYSALVSTRLQAIAVASGHPVSDVASAYYWLNFPDIPIPTLSVAPGTYKTPQTITISDSVPGATIYYAINGYASANSPVYSGPLTVSSTESINVMAVANNYFPSYAGGTYTINPLASTAATPTYSVPAGTYNAPQVVTISDTTAGAFIYYTTDGSTPITSSTVYTGPITVSSSETVQAIAVATGSTLSAIATAAYAINLPSFSITGTAVSISAGATTGNTSTISLTPSNGFTGVINLSCAIAPTAASDQATCSIPTSTTISSPTTQTVTLTVTTTSARTAARWVKRFFHPIVDGTAVACILLVSIPDPRRTWCRRLAMFSLLFIAVGGSLGCASGGGGGGANGSGGTVDLGTSPGSYVITITGTSGSITQVATVNLKVQ